MLKEDELRKVQLKMLEMLKDIDKVCKENNIQYFLDYGSLLGAIRHKGFIPWDDDLDIAMTREDFNKFEKIAQQGLGKEYFIQTPTTDRFYTLFHVPLKVRDNNSKIIEHDFPEDTKFHQGIYIDVFPIDKIPNSKFKQFLCDSYCKVLKYQNLVVIGFESLSLGKKVIYLFAKPIMYFYMRILKYKTRYKIESWLRKSSEKKYSGYQTGMETGLLFKYKEDDIFPIKEVEFESEKFPVPNKYDKILKEYYGDYMKLPNEEDRECHSDEVYFY